MSPDSPCRHQVTLHLERMFGSQDNIQVRYETVSGTAVAGVDYIDILDGAITIDAGQTEASFYVQILSDSTPETDEHFYVNLTSVTKLPTDTSQGA